jgi:hypothetical protein
MLHRSDSWHRAVVTFDTHRTTPTNLALSRWRSPWCRGGGVVSGVRARHGLPRDARMGSPHRPVWLADPTLVAEDRSIDGVRERTELGHPASAPGLVHLVHTPSESSGTQRSPAVHHSRRSWARSWTNRTGCRTLIRPPWPWAATRDENRAARPSSALLGAAEPVATRAIFVSG